MPRFSRGFMRLFAWYLRYWSLPLRFSAVRLSRSGPPRIPEGRAVVVYSNHPSWWDPALFVAFGSTCLGHRESYGPMDAAAFEKYRFFARLGVFPVELGSARGAARFLRIGERLLNDPRTLMWVTAEGAFTDARRRPVRLKAGLAHLARRVPGAAFVPLALEYPFWNEAKPEALLRFGPPVAAAAADIDEWQALLERRLEDAMDALAGEAQARNPAAFQTIVDGRLGIGLVRDLLRGGAQPDVA